MCGIAGFTNFNIEARADDAQIVTRMCDLIAHRGPDEYDIYNDANVALGHRRLSIVGLDDGKQPMTSSCGNYVIVFNGEVYNYKDLRAKLEADGFKFRTGTDTEIVLNSFIKSGLDSIKSFNGMFACAIWDKTKQQLHLLRDRAGKKPLFYYYKNGDLIFSSELKSLVSHPRFEKKISLNGMNKFFTYEYIPGPHTVFENTYKVEAGQVISFSAQNKQEHFYWNYPSIQLYGQEHYSEDEAAERIEEILIDAVKLRLQADVPVGVFLSGGIDSSLVTAIATKYNTSAHKLKSFSIYFNEKSYDESSYIKRVSETFGTEHHAEVVDSKAMLGLIGDLGSIMDEPMADASLVPTYFLSKVASKEVKTVLGGDGADEIFAGYPTYVANKLVNLYNIIPYELRRRINSLFQSEKSLLPVSNKNLALDILLKQFFRGAGIAGEIRFFRWMGGLLESEKAKLYPQAIQDSLAGELPYEDVSRYLSRVNIYSELDRLLYLSQKMYLTDDILVKVDRASMMNSLEVRAPFLDYRMVEFAASLPDRYKLKGFRTKHILKKVAKKYIPDFVINRSKKGFGIPITEWLCKDLREPLYDLLSKDRLEQQGLFSYDYVSKVIDDHVNYRSNNRKILWPLLCFQLWYDAFMTEGDSVPAKKINHEQAQV